MGSKRGAVAAVVIGIATLLFPSGAGADVPQRYIDEVFTDVTVTSDIVYGAAVNDQGVLQQLDLDVYEPAGDIEDERPLFVWAHGGSMVFGDKADGLERQIGNAFAKRGWVVLSINYRLMSQFFPAEDCIHDIICAIGPRLPIAIAEGTHDMQAAVRWARAHAADLRIDPGEITTGGHSAGTALALRTNFNANDPGDSGNPGYPSDVAAAMTNSGSMLDPSVVGPNEPPIIMFNSVNDSDMTLWAGQVTACLPTTVVGNVCEFHGFLDGGHSLSKHRPVIIQKTAEFFCRRVIDGCTVPNPTSYVGPSGSTWDGDVHCGAKPFYNGPKGAEVCTDLGRVFLHSNETGAVYMPDHLQVDGDADNPVLKSSFHAPANPAEIAQVLADMVVSNLPF